ncbi:hypothetical protein LCGC14_2822140, partial [marine sediment metagenome]
RLLGDPSFEATSIQGDGSRYNDWAVELRQRSAKAGRKWAIYGDEQGPPVKADLGNLDRLRKEALWGNLMGGGAGVEWYFGYQGRFGDVQSEDWTVARRLWDQTRCAVEFFQRHLPFTRMAPANKLTTAAKDYCFAQPGRVYAIYLPRGGTTKIKLPAGKYTVRWYDPRNGGKLLTGSVAEVAGGADVAIGSPPAKPGQDWVCLIRRPQP